MLRRYYFDWAAAAPPRVPDPSYAGGEKSVPFGNPSSPHGEGKKAREALEEARRRCAAVLGVRADQIYFTSGASESNAIVLFSLAIKPRRTARAGEAPGGAELLYSAGEHPSVSENVPSLERLGVKSAVLGLDSGGSAALKALEAALEKNPGLRMAAIIGINNETGSVNDTAALGAALRGGTERARPVHFHCDLVQALGKVPLDLGGSCIDSASFSAHKIGGPRGVGLLYLRRPLLPLVRGGGQEGGLRPGTENTAGALAAAACLEERAPAAAASLREAESRMERLISRLRSRAQGRFVPIPEDRGGADSRFSPWILQARFKGIPGAVLVRALDERGFAISTGSACSSGRVKRPVLEAMGLDEETRLEGVRISQGWSTTAEDIEALVEALSGVAAELRGPS
ncbi:MAG: aminotransferase class V-fold PLP-dependent enzyme [Treponema sp.]|jgi:cysteine desulfurase|nr:aminotransferase class V-fold PLP-dependent enzyme [Treponema sp.]